MVKRLKEPKLRFSEYRGTGGWGEEKFSNVFETVSQSGCQIPLTEVLKEGRYEVVDQGQDEVRGYSNEEEKILKDVPVIVYGDHTTIIKYRETPFIVGADGVKLLKNKKESEDIKYLYYALCKRNVEQQGYKRHFSMLKEIKIPIPSKEEQSKIGSFFSLLDSKIQLQQEKVSQLTLYKQGLLQQVMSREIRFKDSEGREYPEWEEDNLSKICTIKTGSSDVQDAKSDGEHVFFGRGSEILYTDDYLFDKEALIYAGEGSSFLPRYIKGKYALHQRCYSLHDFSEKVDIKYIHTYLSTKNKHFLATAVGTTVKSLRLNCFETCSVLLPCKEEQQKIAALFTSLDKKIESEQQKLELLKEQKKGFMQQMFI